MQPLLVTLLLVSALLVTVSAVPHPWPVAAPLAYPEPSPLPCCVTGQHCGLGLCGCCGGTKCENGACNPIIHYADGFYGAPRVCGGYGATYCY